MRGLPTKAQNIIVIREFNDTWAAVSLPLPVKFNQINRLSLRTLRVSSPFGDRFTRLSSVADATKYIFCFSINSM
jgi:hypothetical protein